MSEQAVTTTNGQQTIEQLQERFEKLNRRKIQAETNLENAKNQLDSLKQEAREKYDTDDVEKLRELLARMRAENEKKRSQYQQSLDKIERELEEVRQQFSAEDESGPATEES